MRNNRYTDKELIDAALACKTRAELRSLDGEKMYQIIKIRGLLPKCTAHMVDQRTVKTHGNESIIESAKPFKLLKDWRTQRKSMYKLAKYRGILEACTAHMERSKSVYQGAYQIYAYEFNDRRAYVGLTADWDRRHKMHDVRGPVFRHRLKTGLAPSLKILVPQGVLMSPYAAGDAEDEWVKRYEKDGWTMLNEATAGSTGNISKKAELSADEVRFSANQHKHKSRWAAADYRAYCAARKLGILKEVTAHMVPPPISDEQRRRMSESASSRCPGGVNRPR